MNLKSNNRLLMNQTTGDFDRKLCNCFLGADSTFLVYLILTIFPELKQKFSYITTTIT